MTAPCGLEYVIVMYAGVVLGGLGSVSGAFFGGLTIGLVQQLSTLFLPNQLQNTAIFVGFLMMIGQIQKAYLKAHASSAMTI